MPTSALTLEVNGAVLRVESGVDEVAPYPAASQRLLQRPERQKRNPPRVVKAISDLLPRIQDKFNVGADTLLHAVSSEDEYDMFTTASSLALSSELSEFFWHPIGDEYTHLTTR